MSNPWLDPSIAAQQRALVDAQLTQKPWPAHFAAYADAIRATNCPGEILEVGCGVGHGVEILDRAGVKYRGYRGYDISEAAIKVARERYPESDWRHAILMPDDDKADVVVDGCALMHVDDWKDHLSSVCEASRRWVILHRVPLGGDRTDRFETVGYGHTFPAWRFCLAELTTVMNSLGFTLNEASSTGEEHCRTLTFAKPRHYVTYADSNYLTRLKALHASMVRHCGPFRLHVLAWDTANDPAVLDWVDVYEDDSLIGTGAQWLLGHHHELAIDKLPGQPRSRVEHMWTCGPHWIADVMEQTGEPVTYVDADVMFHSSPEPVFAEIGGAPAAVVMHAFRDRAPPPIPTRKTHEVFGKYNVGFVHFNDRRVADDWADRCRASCYDRISNDGSTYADQRYLDAWPERFGAHVITHPGACAGPWGVHARSLDVRNCVIHFGGRPLVAWHYSGYRDLPDGHTVLTRPEYMLTDRQAEILYRPYIRALEAAR